VPSFSAERFLGETYERKSEDFTSHISKSGYLSKVHAEIQLLFYYETYNVSLPPRVICSNKSACHLCHLFLKLHGQYHIPRTHGRIYEKWLLLTWLSTINEERQRYIGQRLTIFTRSWCGRYKGQQYSSGADSSLGMRASYGLGQTVRPPPSNRSLLLMLWSTKHFRLKLREI
jgi:hypothetical protein